MKLTLTSPQSITIFSVPQLSMVPTSAKSMSFATPQAYYCADTGELRIYLKGEEFCFIDKDSAPALAPVPSSDSVPNGIGPENGRISTLEKRVDTLYETLYNPLLKAFK